MFQTELILFLQSLASVGSTYFMVGVSAMGTPAFLVAILSFIMFAVHLGKGLMLAQLVLWGAFGAQILKELFCLPRPFHVDARISLLGTDDVNPSPFTAAGAEGLFGLPQQPAIDWARGLADVSFGLPSGHTCLATVLWLGLFVLFSRRYLAIGAPVMILLTACSRMYLGLHFVGDVLAGLVLGGLLVLIFAVVSKRVEQGGGERFLGPWLLGSWLLLAICGVLARWENVGILAGLNLSTWLLVQKGLPPNTPSRGQRLGRFLLAPLIYLLARLIFKWGLDPIFPDQPLPYILVRGFLPVFLLFWGTIQIFEGLRIRFPRN